MQKDKKIAFHKLSRGDMTILPLEKNVYKWFSKGW